MKFSVSIDEGPEQQIEVATSLYVYAVAAVPALLDTALPIVVKIWVPDLLPDYGPYYYRVEDRGNGCPQVTHLVPVRDVEAASQPTGRSPIQGPT